MCLIPFIPLLQQLVITDPNPVVHPCFNGNGFLILQHTPPSCQQAATTTWLPIVRYGSNRNTRNPLLPQTIFLFPFTNSYYSHHTLQLILYNKECTSLQITPIQNVAKGRLPRRLGSRGRTPHHGTEPSSRIRRFSSATLQTTNVSTAAPTQRDPV